MIKPPVAVAALFVDGANLSHSLSRMAPEGATARIDYRALVRAIARRTGAIVIRKHYYTGYRTEEDLAKRWAFLEVLKRDGWQVFCLPAKMDERGRWRDKEVDLTMALDAYEAATSGKFAHVVLGTGGRGLRGAFPAPPGGRPRMGGRIRRKPRLGARPGRPDDRSWPRRRRQDRAGAPAGLVGKEPSAMWSVWHRGRLVAEVRSVSGLVGAFEVWLDFPSRTAVLL